jgi:hypothetical protein
MHEKYFSIRILAQNNKLMENKVCKNTKECSIFKITETKELIDEHINGDNYSTKFKLQDLLYDFYSKTEGKFAFDEIQSVVYDPKFHRSLRSKKKSITKSLEKLQVVDATITSDLYKQFNTIEPSDLTDEQKNDFLKKKISALGTEINTAILQQDGLHEKKDALTKSYLADRMKYLKACSKEYKAMRDKLRADNKIILDNIRANDSKLPAKELNALIREKSELLEREVSQKLSQESEVFRIKCQIDEVKSQLFRTSKAAKIFSYLLERQLMTIINAVHTTNLSRRATLVIASSKTKAKADIKPCLSDFIAATQTFPQAEFGVFFTIVPSYAKLLLDGSVVFEKKHEKIYNTVRKCADNCVDDNIKYDDTLVKAISVLLHESVICLCDTLMMQVRSSDIYTFKADTFHLVLEPIFKYTMRSYDLLKSVIDKKWKAQVAPK